MKPLIQIDNEVREMTDDEYSAYLIISATESELNLNLETTQE
jgi:hypothetical protein